MKIVSLLYIFHCLFIISCSSNINRYPSQAQVVTESSNITRDFLLPKSASDEINDNLPIDLEMLFRDEIEKNDFFRSTQYAEEFSLLEEFSPTEGRWFYLPHFEIPLDELNNFKIDKENFKVMEELFIFEKNGKKYLKYFVHPFGLEDNYKEILDFYPLKREYVARATSSPRSLIVLKPSEIEKSYWVKVSLHAELTELNRTQKPKKMYRALAVNNFLNSIPKKERINFSWLSEPGSFQLFDRNEIIIARDKSEYNKSIERGTVLRSTFSFFSDSTGSPEIAKMISDSQFDEITFFKKYFIEPVLEAYIYLAFEEGIQWGMHTGNYLTEVDQNGLPTGKIVLKDFDGASVDLETRLIKGKSFNGLHSLLGSDPFKSLDFTKSARGYKSQIQRLGEIYNRYIRNANGFSSLGKNIHDYLSKYCDKDYCKNPDKLKNVIHQMIDEVAIEKIKKISGIHLDLDEMKNGHLRDNGLNKALNMSKEGYLTRRMAYVDQGRQTVLQAEFRKASDQGRIWLDNKYIKGNIRFIEESDYLFDYDSNAGFIIVKQKDTHQVVGYGLVKDPLDVYMKLVSLSRTNCAQAIEVFAQ